ncbi:MAG TPA: RNA-directed DNA polymerase [Paracoccus sp. (in: a-proteobacteria)]|uniref:RNA-directed DNA polymerase n=1 Tax=Paracoccus sp. TaxID=267 RepID=UPI002CAB3426|nr:RNA-directed DNA polymerase [Paracoccus sp. (in: a-proteobacteria)]HWL56537.1 RNA-directed DNA polymerase [Paracoccus sp. (in: a-proteobacteria)]
MKTRFHLIDSGFYPETLPPCFTSRDAKRAFRGIVKRLDDEKFHERKTDYVRYSATKHDGSRRLFGTPNIISYFHISSFLWKNWKSVEKGFGISDFSLGAPKVLSAKDDRAVKVSSLSELSARANEKLRYAPFILQADIAQCFPSIYTHSISWAAHGIEKSKADTEKKSEVNYFNALDFFVRNAQRGNSRGVLIGPDGHRIIAEFILSKIDEDLKKQIGDTIVGAVRHVDDYYIGLRTEHDAQSVLSHLREALANFALNLNDYKTRIYSSMEPINDLWAQRLRDFMAFDFRKVQVDKLERAISEAAATASAIKSDSPIKILLRSLDESEVYDDIEWEYVESYLQRIIQKFPHALDYACLLTAKRHALEESIDKEGWLAVAETIIPRSLALNHHHEVVWLIWLLITCDISLPWALLELLEKSRNGHIRSILIQAYVDGKISRKPRLSLGSGLSTVDEDWLTHLVAKSQGYSSAKFSGDFSSEFQHLSDRRIKLIDFREHEDKIKKRAVRAISRTRYGYDDDSAWEDDGLEF